MVDKKTFAIGVLSLSAVILLAANMLAPRVSTASYNTIKDNDYQLQTATAVQGGDVLYITDRATGIMAAVAFNPGQQRLVLLGSKTVQSSFEKALALPRH